MKQRKNVKQSQQGGLPEGAIDVTNQPRRFSGALPEGAVDVTPPRVRGVSIEPNRYAPVGLRLGMAAVDTEEERRAVFERAYPEGDYVPAGPSSDAMGLGGREAYQPNPDAPWRYMEPERGEAFTFRANDWMGPMGTPIRAQGEMALDAAEFLVGDSIPIAAELGLTLSPIGRSAKGAATFSGRVARMAMLSGGAAAGGEAVDQAVQSFLGVQRQDPLEILTQIGIQGVTSSFGGGMGESAEIALGGMRSTGLLNVPGDRSRLEDAMRTMAGRQGSDVGLMPQQVSDQPWVGRIAGAASKVFPGIPRYIERQRGVLTDTLRSLQDEGLTPEGARNALVSTYDEIAANYRGFLDGIVDDAAIDLEDAGLAIQAVRDDYSQTSRSLVDELYTVAREGGDFRFDGAALEPRLDEFAERHLRDIPVSQPSQPAPHVPFSPGQPRPRSQPTAQRTESIPGYATNSLRSIYSQIRRADFSRLGVEDIRAWQQTLREAADAGPGGEAGISEAAARDLIGILGDMLDSPVSRVGPDGQAIPLTGSETGAWRAANRAARERFETLGQSSLVQIARSDRPYSLARDFVSPSGRVDDVRQLRRAMDQGSEQGARSWGQFQQAFMQDLLSQPDEFLRRWDAYGDNRQILAAALQRDQIEALDTYAAQLRRLDETNIRQLGQLETMGLGFVEEITRSSTPTRQVTSTISVLQETFGPGWRDSAAGRAYRGAVLMSVARDVIQEVGDDQTRINPIVMRRILNRLEASGLDRLLTDADRTVLNDVQALTRVVELSAADMGTSIAAASDVLSVMDRPVTGAVTLAPYSFISRLVTSRAGQNFLTGQGLAQRGRPTQTVGLLVRLVDDMFISDESQGNLQEYLDQRNEREATHRLLNSPTALAGIR